MQDEPRASRVANAVKSGISRSRSKIFETLEGILYRLSYIQETVSVIIELSREKKSRYYEQKAIEVQKWSASIGEAVTSWTTSLASRASEVIAQTLNLSFESTLESIKARADPILDSIQEVIDGKTKLTTSSFNLFAILDTTNMLISYIVGISKDLLLFVWQIFSSIAKTAWSLLSDGEMKHIASEGIKEEMFSINKFYLQPALQILKVVGSAFWDYSPNTPSSNKKKQRLLAKRVPETTLGWIFETLSSRSLATYIMKAFYFVLAGLAKETFLTWKLLGGFFLKEITANAALGTIKRSMQNNLRSRDSSADDLEDLSQHSKLFEMQQLAKSKL